jgi:hypothetical protein
LTAVRVILTAISAAGLVACGADYPARPTFVASLTPRDAVPPTDSPASGEARFYLSESGKAIKYQIEVQDLPNVRTVQLVLADPGKPGDPVYGLYTASPTAGEFTGRFSGLLAEGVLDPALFVGKLNGVGLKALLQQIRSGGIFVRVETDQHASGEIRGKLVSPGA